MEYRSRSHLPLYSLSSGVPCILSMLPPLSAGMATPVLVKMELEIESQLASRTSSPESSASSGRSTPCRINNENTILNGQSCSPVLKEDRSSRGIVPANPLPSVQTVTNDLRTLHERVRSAGRIGRNPGELQHLGGSASPNVGLR